VTKATLKKKRTSVTKCEQDSSGLYHGAVHPLAQRLLLHIRRQELLHPGERVGVAVSGGIDSVTLLRLFLDLRHELGLVLAVIHFNHQLRGAESEADVEFVANLARRHDLPFHYDSARVADCAAQERLSLETAAREMRYAYFRHLLGENFSPGDPESAPVLNKVVTAHTLDDQAETVLMRAIRGTGVRGLAGIYPRILVENDAHEVVGEIVRPLLTTRRHELEQYLAEVKQPWREDASNAEHKFTRNRVRHQLLPMLEGEFNASVVENLAELAEIARGEEDYWENEAAGWHGTIVHWFDPDWMKELERATAAPALVQISMGNGSEIETGLSERVESAPWLVMNASLSRLWLLSESLAVQRRVLKSIGEEARIPLEFRHVEEILHFAAEEQGTGKELSLPLGWKAVRRQEELLFITPDLRAAGDNRGDYEYEINFGEACAIPEAGLRLEIQRLAAGGDRSAYNPDELLNSELLHGRLRVRNWRAGDRYWPSHTKSPKKIKELLQEKQIPQPERRFWPLITSGQEIVWLRGLAVPAKFRAPAEGGACWVHVSQL